MTSVLSRLDDLQRIGIKLGLENIRALLNSLGNPERQYFSILIAGTNGKGSVGAMLEKIIRHHGYQTGFYTSPHLVDIRERIRIDGQNIPVGGFEAVLADVFSAIDSLLENGTLQALPTYFETLTAAAMLHFRNAGVKFAVVEVGLGGRYDATNAIQQNVSVITSIGYDHQEFLGNSLSEIAAEKAAICKFQVPLITGKLPDEAVSAVEQAVLENNCRWIQTKEEDLENVILLQGFPQFHFRPWFCDVVVNLRGRHQAQNAGIALAVCDEMLRLGTRVERATVLEALRLVQWPARLDVISQYPVILLDSAHNAMGVQTLADFLREMKWSQTIALFTAMKDKNLSEMLKEISPRVSEYVLTRVEPLERCASEEQLIEAVNQLGKPYHFQGDTQQAFDVARNKASQANAPLIIFGSIYLAGKILSNYK